MLMQALFLPNQALSPLTRRTLSAAQLLALLAAWSLIPCSLLPKPLEIGQAWGDLWFNQGLGVEIWGSLVVNLEALLIATAISALCAWLTVLPIMRPLVALLCKLRFLGMAGLTLFFTLLVSSGHALKVSILVFGMSVFLITTLAQEVNDIPRERFDHARSLRMPEWRVVWEVVIRGRMAALFEAMRQNAAMGWMMLSMVEGLVRSEGGIGGMLLDQNRHLHLAAVVALQLSVLLIGVAQDYAIRLLKHSVCPYSILNLERV